tara:strand:+ start:427 stop:1296 length:870 start_codon:yes stop_codon:yes gene_type:complete
MGFNLKGLIKKAAPIAIGAFAPQFAMTAGMSPFVSGALASGLGSLAMGNKPKDAILAGIVGGAAGRAFAPAAGSAGGSYDTGAMSALNQARGTNMTAAQLAKNNALKSTAPLSTGFGGFTGKALGTDAETMSGELLKGIGFAGQDDGGNLLFKVLNTKLGEGVAAGLIAKMLAGDDEEIQSSGGSRPFGDGYGGGQLGGINYRYGGMIPGYRAGGAMPGAGGLIEGPGTGTSDSIPGMVYQNGTPTDEIRVSNEEFVFTRDAVKGAGGGDYDKGAKRMYEIMNKFERMA